jgi:hypothetical protein
LNKKLRRKRLVRQGSDEKLEGSLLVRDGKGLGSFITGFYNENYWKIAAPIIFKHDVRFLKWCYRYASLSGTQVERIPVIQKIELKDLWSVMDGNNILQVPGVLRGYVEKTGIEVKELAVFKPERTLLHEVMADIVTQGGGEEDVILKEIVERVCKLPADTEPSQRSGQRYKSFKGITSRKPQRNVGLGAKDDARLINKYTELLCHHYGRVKKRMRVEDRKEALADLIAWGLMKREHQVDVEEMVSQAMVALKKEEGKEINVPGRKYTLDFLATKNGHERDTWVLAGGSASGKTSIFTAKVKGKLVKKDKLAKKCPDEKERLQY